MNIGKPDIKGKILFLISFIFIFFIAYFLGSWIYILSRSIIASSIAIQVIFILLPIAIILLTHEDLKEYGFNISKHYIEHSILISLAISFPLAFISRFFSEKYEISIVSENFYNILFLSLILSPIGEETLFRGFMEGYLLKYVNKWIAILIPAILFTAIHIIPYSSAPFIIFIYTLTGAFILGILAGYFRAISGSLIPAIITHAIFNFSGIIVWKSP